MAGKLLFLPVLLLYLSACNEKQESKETATIKRNDVVISYNSCGEKDTTLLFIHGWCINKEYWDPQLNYFCNRFRVVAIDLPGFGQSGKNRSDWSFDEYADDVKSVIDQLKLKNVIIIGHSMSGDIVLDVADKYPEAVTGLVGIDNLHTPVWPMTAQEKRSTDSFFTQLSTHFDTTARVMSKWLFQPGTDPAIIKRVMNDVYSSDSAIAIKVLQANAAIAQREQGMMRGLPHKLYLVNSDVNPTQLDSLNKYCKWGCELVPVHATGHYPMLEKPAEFNAALEKVVAAIGNEKTK